MDLGHLTWGHSVSWGCEHSKRGHGVPGDLRERTLLCVCHGVSVTIHASILRGEVVSSVLLLVIFAESESDTQTWASHTLESGLV